MFLKRLARRKDGKVHDYWAPIESVRTARGPRHRWVSYLGELTATERAGWAVVQRFLDRQPEAGPDWFSSGEAVPEHVRVNVRKVRVQGIRDFGGVYLGLTLWRALELDRLLEECIARGREEVPWSVVGAILALARFCEPSSELHIADTWYLRTALDGLLGASAQELNQGRLYRGLDEIRPHQEAIERHLGLRFATLFDATFDLVLYDVTSTYFEGLARENPQAQYGYSRDKRFDGTQVCVALVVTREGLPLAYEVFAGNRNDVTTLEEIVGGMERKHGRMGRIWVVDRGIASEENLEYLRRRGGFSVVGTPRGQLKQVERALLEEGCSQVEAGVEVKLCPGPDGAETFVLCRSGERQEKGERSAKYTSP